MRKEITETYNYVEAKCDKCPLPGICEFIGAQCLSCEHKNCHEPISYDLAWKCGKIGKHSISRLSTVPNQCAPYYCGETEKEGQILKEALKMFCQIHPFFMTHYGQAAMGKDKHMALEQEFKRMCCHLLHCNKDSGVK